METTILSISTGEAKKYIKNETEFQSTYAKDNFYDFVSIDKSGIKNDSLYDKKHHGGTDKALHIGSMKHFESFKNIYNTDLDKLAFGCNILIKHYDESDICIGDIYSIGEVKVEVSQPRQPCWKIGALFGKEASRYVSKNHATGWYVRVLQEGILYKKDTMKLEKRVSDITIKELSVYLETPPKEDKDLIEKILNIDSLAQSYKDDFTKSLTIH
jgi:MOSC domain-containing protein YiiM